MSNPLPSVPPSTAVDPTLPVSRDALDALFERHALPAPGRARVLEVLDSEPVRRVGGGRSNTCVRFVSRKMKRVVQAESRGVELAYVYRIEYDPDVLLYLCQPTRLPVSIVDRNGRPRTIYHTPDYLVVDGGGFAFVECKGLPDLEADQRRPHPRFVREDARWRFPAAERACEPLGIQYRVVCTEEEVNALWLRNVQFLRDFHDAPEPEGVGVVVECVARARSVCLADLLCERDVRPESVYWAIAHGRIWFDDRRQRIFESDQAWLHDCAERMQAHGALLAQTASGDAPAPSPWSATALTVRLESGVPVLWEGVAWTVLNRSASTVTLQREGGERQLASIPVADVARLVRGGALAPARSCDLDASRAAERERLIMHASPQELETAARRAQALAYHRAHGVPPKGVSPRAIRNFARWSAEGERRYGVAFAGLIRRRGRRPGTSNLCPAQEAVLEEVVEAYAADASAGRVAAAHSRLHALCEERAVSPVPSYEALRVALARRRRETLERARLGARAAYQVTGPAPAGARALSRHGDRVFEVGHLDHTQLDVSLVGSADGTVLGRPWLTLLADARTRMPLAFHLTFDPPSRMSVAAVLYDCVRRHARVPDTLVLDQGAEFNSVAAETTLALLGVDKVERPAGAARVGSIVERLFGITNTRFLHELRGTTRHTALHRGLSSSHRPERRAAWTLPALDSACERWFFEVYPRLRHGALRDEPGALFARLLERDGERVARFIACDEALRVVLAQYPSPPKRRVCPVRGVVVDYLRFWNEEFQYGATAHTDVWVKIDPADCGFLYVYVEARGRWVRATLVDGDADLRGRSWKQIRLALAELRARRRGGRAGSRPNARILGRFLRELDAHGDALARQIVRDAEARVVRARPVPSGLDGPGTRLVGHPSVSEASADVPCRQRPPGDAGGAHAQAPGPASPDESNVSDGDDSEVVDLDSLDPFDVR